MEKEVSFKEEYEKMINSHSKEYFKFYNQAYSQTHKDLLKQKDTFGFETIYFIAFKNSPDSFTKSEISNLALDVLDNDLNNGLINLLDASHGIYQSAFVNNKENEESEPIR